VSKTSAMPTVERRVDWTNVILIAIILALVGLSAYLCGCARPHGPIVHDGNHLTIAPGCNQWLPGDGQREDFRAVWRKWISEQPNYAPRPGPQQIGWRDRFETWTVTVSQDWRTAVGQPEKPR
jgi:hypothetical protein